VVFNGGSYFISDTVYLKKNCNYSGRNGASIIGYPGGGPGGYPLFRDDDPAGGNMTISGLSFTGGGIAFPDSGGSMTNVNISGCTFQNFLTTSTEFGLHQFAIFTGGGVLFRNSSIDHNTFTNMGTPAELSTPFNDSYKTGIVLYSVSNVTISSNTFDLIAGNGISLSYGSNSPHPGLKIINNKFTRVHRIPIEVQLWYLSNAVISGNSISLPYYPYTYGISFAAGGGAIDDLTNATGALIQNNVLDFTQTAAGNNNAWASCIEVSGAGTVLDHNTCMNGPGLRHHGLWSSAVVVAGVDAKISNNTFCGPWKDGSITYEPPHPEQNGHPATVTNNTVLASCASLAPATGGK
jgi:hypothetical protein